jgi:integrase
VRAPSEHRGRQAGAIKGWRSLSELRASLCHREGWPLIRLNVIQKHFKPILKRAKLPETLRLYDLRHTCATLLLAANENPKVVSERPGHASITLMMDVYPHVLPDMQQGASDKLESLCSRDRHAVGNIAARSTLTLGITRAPLQRA